jgi:predicted O-methyltransferase YrrM
VAKSKYPPGLHRALSHLRKGGLHRALGVAEGEKIPAAKLAAAKNSKDPHVAHMARFAETLEGFDHRGEKK